MPKMLSLVRFWSGPRETRFSQRAPREHRNGAKTLPKKIICDRRNLAANQKTPTVSRNAAPGVVPGAGNAFFGKVLERSTRNQIFTAHPAGTQKRSQNGDQPGRAPRAAPRSRPKKAFPDPWFGNIFFGRLFGAPPGTSLGGLPGALPEVGQRSDFESRWGAVCRNDLLW